jgi:hypothetical protein
MFKALYYSKVWSKYISSKTVFFILVEKFVNKYIDNSIKLEDHSLRYSYKKKDV